MKKSKDSIEVAELREDPEMSKPRLFAVKKKTAEKNPSERVSSKSKKKEPNPLDKAMDILDGYYKDTPPMELKGCGCCEKDE